MSDMESDNRQKCQIKKERSMFVHSLSKLYGIFLTIMAMVIAWAHIISRKEVSASIPMIYFSIIYGVSLFYLIYIHIYLMKNLTSYRPNNRTVYAVTVQVNPDDSKSIPGDTLRKSKDDISSENNTLKSRRNNNVNDDTLTKSYKDLQISNPYQPRIALYRQSNVDYPNFYLRVGAMLFGAGDMVYHGLELGKVAGDTLTCGKDVDTTRILASGLHFILVFYQVYFIFKHSKIAIKSHKGFIRFGLMHLQAANFCACVMALMKETLRSSTGVWLYHGEKQALKVNTDIGGNGTVAGNQTLDPDICSNQASMTNIFNQSSPYLYPCIIQYGIIGIAAMGNIYKHIGPAKEGKGQYLSMSRSEPDNADDSMEIETGNRCHRSYRGLFLGIIVFIGSVIALIIFSVFNIKEELQAIAGGIYIMAELVVLFMTFCATTVAMFQIRHLPFDAYRLPTHYLDRCLLILSVASIYSFDGFRAILALHEEYAWVTILSLVRPFISSVQATVQIILIFDGIKRYTHTQSLLRCKPGRESVVFILITNLSLWAMYMFEANTTYGDKDLFKFFNHDAWFLVLNFTTPLVVFFRFHSATCLYEIWKTSYRLEKSTEGFVTMNTIS